MIQLLFCPHAHHTYRRISWLLLQGGTQASEGFDGGGAFFIENVLEELDFPSEWYGARFQQEFTREENHLSFTPLLRLKQASV
jgi:hypothetical protein